MNSAAASAASLLSSGTIPSWSAIKLVAYRRSSAKPFITSMYTGVYSLSRSQSVEKVIAEKTIFNEGFLLSVLHVSFTCFPVVRSAEFLRLGLLVSADLISYKATAVAAILDHMFNKPNITDTNLDQLYTATKIDDYDFFDETKIWVLEGGAYVEVCTDL